MASGRINIQKSSGLKKESVAHVSQLITLDRSILSNAVGRLPAQKLREVDDGIRLALAI
ncbi:MAG: type II toxin-antitoxin system PemK/MazF family toxin [Proteobacteria bacterium]|nr:type II toxin-antitoxin system PemK/MazF family toxin [Pseudomonadota bacterium]